MLSYKNNKPRTGWATHSGCLCVWVFVFLLGDLRDRDQTLCGTVQDSGCKGVWQVVWCGVWGKQVYGVMGDGRQIHALISQLEYIYLFFFLFQAASMHLENKYLFEGFMVSIKSGFLKLGQKNRTMILPSGKLTYIFKMYHVVLLTQTELYLWKHFPFGFWKQCLK